MTERAPLGRCAVRALIAFIVPLACAAPLRAQAAPPHTIESPRIRAHLSFLADDMLEGRAPGTRGAAIAARYIASQLLRAGVEPVRGSFYQTVPLIGWRPDPRRIGASFGPADNRVALRYPDDLIAWIDSGADSVAVRGEVVFAGYGVRAPEYQWDDYKGRDVRGRIVVVLSNDPPAPPAQPLVFDGPAMSYYGRYTYKIEEARRQGAAAVVIVHTTEGAGYPWSVVQTSWTGEQFALPLDTASAAPLQLNSWITFDAARRLLAAADLDLAELYVRAARRDFQPVFTGMSLQLRAAGRVRRFDAANVVGIVTGRHPARRAEAVVYTAHYDHLGIGAAVDGDSIYNGAYDNASGVALLLQLAESFAQTSARPDRSIVFVFTTAEEAGMLGASWYVRQPAIPLQRTVAALNIDGANLWGETNDISAVGLERSTLGALFEQHAATLGLRVEAERAPDKGFFFRSDHFPFARAGVPALYLDHGVEYRNRPVGWGDAVLSRYELESYHKPSDGYSADFDLRGAVQQGIHAFLLGLDVANAERPPRWYSREGLPPP
jgi:Zn-dependent M28 family amino/carboxypeptidase